FEAVCDSHDHVHGGLHDAQLRQRDVALGAEQGRYRELAEHLLVLQAITSALSEAVTPEDVAAVAARRGAHAVGAARAIVARPSDDGKTLTFLHAFGVNATSLPIEADLPLAIAFRSREAVWLPTPASIRERFREAPVLASP